MIGYHLLALLIGCTLDAILGDPSWLPHPVCVMGRLIAWLERRLRPLFSTDGESERRAGVCLVLSVLAITGLVSFLIVAIAYRIAPLVGIAAEGVMCGQMMAWRSLKRESQKVMDALEAGDVEKAKWAVSMIVGRDTKDLTDEGIARAAIETVAENTSDGVIAPLFYMALGGGIAIYLYKAVNTMDSMVGYHNDEYENFGKAAARLDDVCNYLPARISAFFMMAAGFLMEGLERLEGRSGTREKAAGRVRRENQHYCGKEGVRSFKRDRYKHKSPNSAQTESVCAGVLGIRLAGPAWYFGKFHHKPFIGDGIRPVEYGDILRANRLMTGTYLLALLTAAAALWLLAYCL